MPFSTEKLSAGRPASDQARMVIGLPSVVASEKVSLQGMCLRRHKAFQSSRMFARYCKQAGRGGRDYRPRFR